MEIEKIKFILVINNAKLTKGNSVAESIYFHFHILHLQPIRNKNLFYISSVSNEKCNWNLTCPTF